MLLYPGYRWAHSSSSVRSRDPGGSRLPLSLPHTQLVSAGSTLPIPVCWFVPQGPQFLPWNPFLSSWLCSSAPPSALGVPQSPQPCSETKPFLFTCRPHFPSSTSESFPFPPSALQSPLLTPSSQDCAGAAFSASPLVASGATKSLRTLTRFEQNRGKLLPAQLKSVSIFSFPPHFGLGAIWSSRRDLFLWLEVRTG